MNFNKGLIKAFCAALTFSLSQTWVLSYYTHSNSNISLKISYKNISRRFDVGLGSH